MNKICCFAGHSSIIEDEFYDDLVKVIEKLIIEENVNEFWVGNYGGFDAVSAKAVRSMKEKYPHIELNLVIPYLTSEINEYKQQYYKNYDNILMADIPETTPKRFHIIKCNEYMVQKSDFMVCYVKYTWGGAYRTFEYAQKRNIKIINIAKKGVLR